MTFSSAAWAQADVNDNGRTEPPDPGLYDVTLVSARAFTSKAGNDTIVIEFRVVSGPQAGYEWPDVRGFKNEGQTKAAKSMCSRIGVVVDEVSSLEEIDEQLKRFVGCYYEVEVVQNGTYRNTYIQNQVQSGEPGASDIPSDPEPPPAPDAAGLDTDDVPF